MTEPTYSTPRLEAAAQVLSIIALLTLLKLGLLIALIAGLLIYHLVHLVAPPLMHVGVNASWRKTAALTIVVSTVAVLVAFGVVKLINVLTGGLDGIVQLLQRMAEVVDTARSRLPEWAQTYLPENTGDMQTAVATWLREHASQLGSVGTDLGRFLFHLIIGLVNGSLVAVQGASGCGMPSPFGIALAHRVTLLSDAFQRIVFSQIRISALNTTLTAIYLAIILPAFGVHLPLLKTMIAVTFLAGLLPVLGNLISNTVIFLVSLSVSPAVAIAALAYLIVIHKLEYFMNARIIGSRIQARAWELLIAMLVMEAAFGIPGLVAAPIYYAYLKNELKYAKLL